jgi:hypothetical protein
MLIAKPDDLGNLGMVRGPRDRSRQHVPATVVVTVSPTVGGIGNEIRIADNRRQLREKIRCDS